MYSNKRERKKNIIIILRLINFDKTEEKQNTKKKPKMFFGDDLFHSANFNHDYLFQQNKQTKRAN